jgi:hypothetical protein
MRGVFGTTIVHFWNTCWGSTYYKIDHFLFIMLVATLAIAVSATSLGIRAESAQECLSRATTDGKVDYTYFNGCNILRCERKCSYEEKCTRTCRWPKGEPKQLKPRSCNIYCYDSDYGLDERCFDECRVEEARDQAEYEKRLIAAALE